MERLITTLSPYGTPILPWSSLSNLDRLNRCSGDKLVIPATVSGLLILGKRPKIQTIHVFNIFEAQAHLLQYKISNWQIDVAVCEVTIALYRQVWEKIEVEATAREYLWLRGFYDSAKERPYFIHQSLRNGTRSERESL